jgi:hypothetical protein
MVTGFGNQHLDDVRFFNPADLSRAPADLTVSGAQVTVRAKLTFRNSDLHRPWFEPSLARLA